MRALAVTLVGTLEKRYLSKKQGGNMDAQEARFSASGSAGSRRAMHRLATGVLIAATVAAATPAPPGFQIPAPAVVDPHGV